MSRPPCILLVAAEPSGDALGAGLAAALKRRAPGVRLVGVGGPRMAAEGVDSPFDIAELSVLGLFEGLKAYPRVVRRADETAALAARERPDAAVLIDSWGFTLRVAKRLRRLDPDMLLVKYVGPQVWASRPGRAKTLAGAVDHLLSILPFDAPIFEAAGLATTFVGNPTLARDVSAADPQRCRAAIGAGPEDPILLLLPGSRRSEIEHVLPPFVEAVGLLTRERPSLKVVLPLAPSVAATVKALAPSWPFEVHIVEGDVAKADAFAAATVALACSGTVTTELAMAGRPMVVGYKVGRITAALLRRLVRTKWITLVNIAAGRAIAPELIQEDCNGPALASAVAERLDDPALAARQAEEQFEALGRMKGGGPDPSEAAADKILALLAGRRR